jgi:hypothetical protein
MILEFPINMRPEKTQKIREFKEKLRNYNSQAKLFILFFLFK